MSIFSNTNTSKKKISIIGSGNLAWHLLPALENAGFQIGEIYSKQIANAEKLASQVYQGKAQSHLDFSSSESALFIIAVSDQAIAEVVAHIALPNGAVLVHTSGTTALKVLEKFEHRGVFYPIQTFSKNRKINFAQSPIVIEASTLLAKETLVFMANKLKSNYTFLDTEDRKTIHLAAVFACNFTNHLLGIANELLDQKDLDLSILQPLVQETIAKALGSGNPYQCQTGPALRKDEVTMQQHLSMLSTHPDLKHIYQLMSERIKNN